MTPRRLYPSTLHRRIESLCRASCQKIGRTWDRLPFAHREDMVLESLKSLSHAEVAAWEKVFTWCDVLRPSQKKD